MKRILVIEDDKSVLENISELLESEDFQVFKAGNGLLGLEMARKILPDLIISDIMMPKLDGFGVIKALSEQPTTANIPFIFLSARAEKSDLRLGMELGADDFLSKPFSPEELYGAVNARLKKKTFYEIASEEKIKEFSLNIAANIPHELRTPLNGMLGTAQILKDYYDTLDEDTIKELHSTLFFSAKRLESLIYKYLLFVETELVLLNSEKLSYARHYNASLPSSTISSTIDKISKNKLREGDITYTFEEAGINIYDEHLKAIIQELVENAVKFSKSGTQIVIIGKVEDKKYVIEVSDLGIGMSKEDIERIGVMKQFGRKEMEQQGLGLGLAIVSRLARIYNGEFLVDSSKGKYTKIIVKLNIC